MGWLFVFLAASSELVGVVGLKRFSEQKTVMMGLLYGLGIEVYFLFLYYYFLFLYLCDYISFLYIKLYLIYEVNTAYAFCIGNGNAGTEVIKMFIIVESKSVGKEVSVIFIVIGVVGLKAMS